jgi:hypothetical protein
VSDFFDTPRGGAEHERVADVRFEHHFLVELADSGAARRRAEKKHAEQAAVGDGAAVGDRDSLRSFTRDDGPGDAVPCDAGTKFRKLVRWIAPRQHVEHAFKGGASQFGEGRRAADGCEQIVNLPLVHRRHRHDLLREDVEWVAGIVSRLDCALVHRSGDCRARHEVAAEFWKHDAFADRVDLMTAAADPLESAGD